MLRFCTFVSPEVNTSGMKGLKSHSASPKERGNHLHARTELSPPRGTGVTLEQSSSQLRGDVGSWLGVGISLPG